MRVLIVSPYLGEVYGGISNVVKQVFNALCKQQVSVDLITTNANSSTKLQVPLNTWINANNSNGRIQYFNCWHKQDFIFSRQLLSWLYHNVKAYDIVHTHTLFSPLIKLACSITDFQGVSYLMTPHGMLEPWALQYKAWKKRLYYVLLEKQALDNSVAIQSLTPVEVKQIKGLGFHKLVLVPNGINFEKFKGSPSPFLFYESFPNLKDKNIILFLGRIDPKKGLDLLARSFAKVIQTHENTHLVVAGPDSIGFLPNVKVFFDKAQCAHQVTFTGMLSGDLKWSALAVAQAYVAPSYSEGFSISILEGMSSGLPCVIPTGCNFPEAAKANAAKVVDIQADAIAQALIEFLSDPLAAKVMGDRARQFVLDHYTWDSIAAQLIEVYTAILTKKPLPAS